jgi:hypothetical protein
MEEIWKTHPNWPNYEFSNLGKARSYYKRGKAGGTKPIPTILKQSINGFGYSHITLKHANGRYKMALLHHIIADLFLPPKPDHPTASRLVIDHINGDKMDSSATNLQWITQSENLNRSRVYKDREQETLTLVEIIQIWKLTVLGWSWKQIQENFYPQYSYYKLQHWANKGRALFARYKLDQHDLDLIQDILRKKEHKWS